ncbi:MAG: efflux RND transporter permease subunit, partial [Gammaproteobacteria bacterium]|nr:efflux RND transporter permease subunit [Gammaproteobacteria bacterium]
MTRAFINSPLSPLLFFAMLFTGLMGLVVTPRQEDPQISVPMVDIFVRYPGASAEQVASLAVEPLERIMSEIPGVEHVYSASKQGQGIVTVQFFVGEALNDSILKVHDRIQRNMDKIPPGVPPPLVKPKSIDDVPVVNLTLWSPEIADSDLRKLALDVLQQLKEIPNTGESFIVGGRVDQVRVEVYSERLSGYGIGLDQVAQTIRTANAEQQAGDMEAADTYFTVYTGAFLRNAEQISRLVVGERNGVPVYVRDLARVRQEPKDADQIVEFYTGPAGEHTQQANGVPAVTIAVAKKEGANGVEVANAVLAKVEDLKGVLIPSNVQVAITRDYGQTANDKVNELIAKLFKATGFVFLLVLFAFRALRPALVVLLVIPVVILFTVFAAWVMGYTIDRVSLFALIFSIGILVDDAIVVVENIYRRWLEKGTTDTETAVDAVREVGNPTIIATFTVVAALLPMGFVRGMMGPYMEPIPALGSVAMVFSLLAAFIFTPWWAMRLKPSMAYLEKAEKREHEGSLKLERLFRRVLTPLIEHRGKRLLFKLTLWVGLGLSMLMFYTTWVPVKMLPLDNKPEFSVVINMPEGTALPVTANVARRLATEIRDHVPEVTALQTYVGTARPFDFNGMVRHYYLRQQPWEGEIQIQLTHKNDRELTSHDLAVMARERLVPIAEEMGAAIQIVEMPPGPPVLQTVVAEIYGPDAQTRRQFAQEMTELFRAAPNISDVDNYLQAPYDSWRFEVDTEKALRRGISVDTVNRNVAMAMGNFKLGDIKVERVLEPTHIVIQVPLSVRAQITNLGDLPILSDTGRPVPLAELGRFVRVPEDPLIFHKDLRPVEYVTGEATGRLA